MSGDNYCYPSATTILTDRVASTRNVTEVALSFGGVADGRWIFRFSFGTLGLTLAEDKATQGCDLSAD